MSFFVTPAEAGAQGKARTGGRSSLFVAEAPACAGVTVIFHAR